MGWCFLRREDHLFTLKYRSIYNYSWHDIMFIDSWHIYHPDLSTVTGTMQNIDAPNRRRILRYSRNIKNINIGRSWKGINYPAHVIWLPRRSNLVEAYASRDYASIISTPVLRHIRGKWNSREVNRLASVETLVLAVVHPLVCP